ncbi:hypothetical protein GCM10007315_25600 [Gemmobacter tilapiae]|uniref:IrrE N-terminal-like domain-containing protein n=2 Tax=Neogemmobacter tilapiae TaxID=875041 RepID=A0A918TSH9_9RHOB|nr:hypothetical protein GCM10007315_25600 [Gemmobacter tilapiae]
MLLTDRLRTQGQILVNTKRGMPAARFSLAHELGHFLLERHVLGLDGRFTCTQNDLREARTAQLHQRQEAEANAFAIALLAPQALAALFTVAEPSIAAARGLRDRLELSLEAAARCLVARHDEPLAAVWTKNRVIRYVVRGPRFPWIERGPQQVVSALSRTAEAFGRRLEGTTAMGEVAPAAWTNADIPELFEQVRIGKEGHALTLLWATLPECEDEED